MDDPSIVGFSVRCNFPCGGVNNTVKTLCFASDRILFFCKALHAVAIPNATKTPQSVAGASYDFNDVHFLTACQFARRPHAATCLPGSDSFIIASTAAGIASRSQRPLPGRDLHSLELSAFFTAHLGHHTSPFAFFGEASCRTLRLNSPALHILPLASRKRFSQVGTDPVVPQERFIVNGHAHERQRDHGQRVQLSAAERVALRNLRQRREIAPYFQPGQFQPLRVTPGASTRLSLLHIQEQIRFQSASTRPFSVGLPPQAAHVKLDGSHCN